MSKKRFSEHQLVGNDDILLWQLALHCFHQLETTLYGAKKSLKQEQHPDRRILVQTALDLFAELHITREELLTAWDERESSERP